MSTTDAEVDPAVWNAIAGSSVQIPPRSSRVYYFPQGHLENSSATPIQSYSLFLSRPFILCQVSSVQFLSDDSDQVYAKIHLQHLHPRRPRLRDIGNNSENVQNDFTSYAKILTRSDVNKQYGRFCVPKSCAELIFPWIDVSAEPPTAFQNLIFKDNFNLAWEFRHVYGIRHFLTSGWSSFLNSKKLVAGDSVVFIRKHSTNELFIGIRRSIHADNMGRWNFPLAKREKREKLALEAISLADQGISFDVEYYPRVGTRDFVVSAERVEETLFISKSSGLRVKMAVETELFSKKKWFLGTISATTSPHGGTWIASPWRMLQVYVCAVSIFVTVYYEILVIRL
ncbi:auxin response factor 17 [Olea europaea subsp. europaea]|uniref:Auxin response factor n=1 Tax=Olea europaea subsp. europaea TaxID=158383 RepID=A0A8S0T3T9_OLEEU|nr:auxin response factor 17 [Olea europaea subsp. europaea]